MEKLRTDYADAVFQGLRKYRKIDNSDGTVSFRDVTDYTAEGSIFGAKDINATNEAVNAAQKKDSVDGTDYTELIKNYTYNVDIENQYFIGTPKLGNDVSVWCRAMASVDGIGFEKLVNIKWHSGEDMVTCRDDTGIDIGRISTICMYKNSRYCINLLEILKKIVAFDFTMIRILSVSDAEKVFCEKIDGAYGAVANLMKQIGSAPLGFGDGTLTGAMGYLYRELYQKKKGTLTTSLSGTNDKNKITRIGNIVMVEFRIYNTSFSGFNNVIANIPEEFRPSEEVNIVGYALTAAGGQFACPYKIATNGNVTQWYSSAEFAQFGIFGTYII